MLRLGAFLQEPEDLGEALVTAALAGRLGCKRWHELLSQVGPLRLGSKGPCRRWGRGEDGKKGKLISKSQEAGGLVR